MRKRRFRFWRNSLRVIQKDLDTQTSEPPPTPPRHAPPHRCLVDRATDKRERKSKREKKKKKQAKSIRKRFVIDPQNLLQILNEIRKCKLRINKNTKKRDLKIKKKKQKIDSNKYNNKEVDLRSPIADLQPALQLSNSVAGKHHHHVALTPLYTLRPWSGSGSGSCAASTERQSAEQ